MPRELPDDVQLTDDAFYIDWSGECDVFNLSTTEVQNIYKALVKQFGVEDEK